MNGEKEQIEKLKKQLELSNQIINEQNETQKRILDELNKLSETKNKEIESNKKRKESALIIKSVIFVLLLLLYYVHKEEIHTFLEYIWFKIVL